MGQVETFATLAEVKDAFYMTGPWRSFLGDQLSELLKKYPPDKYYEEGITAVLFHDIFRLDSENTVFMMRAYTCICESIRNEVWEG